MRNLPRLWISRSPMTKLWKAVTAPPAYPQPVAVPYTSLDGRRRFKRPTIERATASTWSDRGGMWVAA